MSELDRIIRMTHRVHRRMSILERGGHDKKYNIVFYGIGNVAKEGLNAICNAPVNMFDLPIDKIYLVGRNKPGRVEERQRLAREFNVELRDNPGCSTQVIPKSVEELPDILPKTEDGVKTIFAKERITLGENDIKKILEIVAKYIE